MRCFIAAHISEKSKKGIYEISGGFDRGLFKVVSEENLHITVKFLGEIGEDEVEACKRAIDGCVSGPVRIKIEGGGAFPNMRRARVIFVNAISDELGRIANCIRNRTVGIGDERPYIGHITVARVRGGPVDASKIIGELGKIEIEGGLQKISLMKSTLTPEGPVYEEIYAKVVGVAQ